MICIEDLAPKSRHCPKPKRLYTLLNEPDMSGEVWQKKVCLNPNFRPYTCHSLFYCRYGHNRTRSKLIRIDISLFIIGIALLMTDIIIYTYILSMHPPIYN